jgi:DNA/RNA non-specific endonuclease
VTPTIRKADIDRQVRETASDLLDVAFALCGLTEPARFRAGASDARVLAHGRWLDYALNRGDPEYLAGWFDPAVRRREHIPCVGELAGRWPRFLRTVETAVGLAESAPRAAEALGPGLSKLEQAAHWFPPECRPEVAEIQRRLRDFLARFAPGTPRFEKPDVCNQFEFPPETWDASGRVTRTARGWLGVPSLIRKHNRNRKAHDAINADFPDDNAGHLIARDFGAPADARNLAPQNTVANCWGSYRAQERRWAAALEVGYGIEVTVEVVTRDGQEREDAPAGESAPARPDRRHTRWTQVAPDGTLTEGELSFLDRPTPEELWEELRDAGKRAREAGQRVRK